MAEGVLSALAVERDGADCGPVAGLSAPVPGMVLTSGLIKGLTGPQEDRVFVRMTLLRVDLTEASGLPEGRMTLF